ncbi:alpha/beta-hydrolase [Coprinopsis sp. MPI-PUGE-AT-0042]|nr:alpha/beta-hydrolase [Coprinopsis sp. MPI-PUGE-AT-0042]
MKVGSSNLSSDVGSGSYDSGLFTPLESLSVLSESQFSTLQHPSFPKHSVRIKRSKFCDGTVRAFTGYIDVGARHLFFYFFESRSDPSKDDVILWTNGGPGGSSSMGLLMEQGPCRINGPNATKYFEHAWNDNANIFFIDQPVGTGFSYADYGEAVSTTEEAAEDVANFMYVFFEHFTQFRGRKFHMAGESYGGRYIPLFASYIYDQNAKLEEMGVAPINLASVMIGNGYTHVPDLIVSYYDMACTAASLPPILGIRTCVRMKQAQIRCKTWLKETCLDKFDDLGCQAANSFCQSEMTDPVVLNGWNPYDISQKCDGTLDGNLCYPVSKDIDAYLNRPDVKKLIGADSYFDSHNMTNPAMQVWLDFARSSDILRSSYHYVSGLLEHGVKVLIYVGKTDWICNHIANEKWVMELDWSGKEGFHRAKKEEWSVLSKSHTKGGEIRSHGGLTYLTIEGAGHMVRKAIASLLTTHALQVPTVLSPKKSLKCIPRAPTFAVVARSMPGTMKMRLIEPLTSSCSSGRFGTLSALSDVHFTTLYHSAFPKHSVRIKQTKFCDGTVRSFTGYIDVGARHLFFYFFESRSNPAKDDVILWTNGGPGCSSALGMLMEVGPCRIGSSNGTRLHPQSWNDKANIFFIDQPVGVGFSYAEYGGAVHTTEEAAEDVANFVYVFFEHFTEFKGRKFHLAGESYGGRYLPLFASYIYDQNAKLKDSGVTPINLASVMIGNDVSFTDVVDSLYDMACTGVSVSPRMDIRQQARMRCKDWLRESCGDAFDAIGCQAASAFCTAELAEPIFASGWNPYDLSRRCDGSIETTLCYPPMISSSHIASYLNRPEVRSLLGVDSFLASSNFTSCSTKIAVDFAATMDEIQSDTHLYVASLLEHGVKVLIYVGKNDPICNHVGNAKWLHDLDWSGKEEFGRAEMKSFVVDRISPSEARGDVKSFGGLTFLTINDAGHMAPYDKPDQLLWMVSRWMEGHLSW